MTTATLNREYFTNILHLEAVGAEFPIIFDDVWESSGYTNKHHAVRFLTERCDAKEGEDYIVLPERVQTPQGGRSSNSIRFSFDGYDYFLSRSNTPQGKANLRCLIQIKRAYLRDLELRLLGASPAIPQVDPRIAQLQAENEKLKSEVKSLKKNWEIFADEIALNGMLREHGNKLYMEKKEIENKLINRTNDVANLTAENEKLKAEVKQLLSDLDTKFTKNKPLKENLELHRKLNELSKIQEQCFYEVKFARRLLSDFEDMTEMGIVKDFHSLVDELVLKIKPKLYKAYDLNVIENDILSVELDWDKILLNRDEENNLMR